MKPNSSLGILCIMACMTISATLSFSNDLTCGSITGLKIYDGDTDSPSGLGFITEGQNININSLPSNYFLTIEVSPTIESVAIMLDGNTQSIENIVPYTWGNGNANWNGGLGSYLVEADAFLSDNGAGELCDQLSINFSIVDNEIVLPTTPTCDAGSFLWQNTITLNKGVVSSAVRFIDGTLTSHAIAPASFPAEFSGPVSINISEAISWDGYAGRTNTGNQPTEQWRVIFRKGGTTVYTSPYTGDIATGVESDEWLGSLGTEQFFPNGVDEIIIAHYENVPYGTGGSPSANSVSPSSICFTYDACALTLSQVITPNEACQMVPENATCECNGKMQNLTLVYNGVDGDDVDVYESSGMSGLITSFTNVQNGQVLFVSAENLSGGDFNSWTWFSINNGPEVGIHTSCSQDIIGDIFGNYTVVGYTDGAGNICNPIMCTGAIDLTVLDGSEPYSFLWSNGSTEEDPAGLCEGDYSVMVTDANGCSASSTFTVDYLETTITATASLTSSIPCEPEILPTCECICDDQIVSMTLQYSGANGADVNVWNNSNHSILIASFTNVQNGAVLFADATGILPGDDFENTTYIEIVDGAEVNIHTSCSDDIGGLTYGDFTVIGFTDVPGNVCDVTNCVALCPCDGKMQDLTLLYVGNDGDNVDVYDASDLNDLIVSFSDVQNGQILYVSAENLSGGDFESTTWFTVNGGTAISIHTSCSDDIQGLTFGNFQVVGYTDGAGNVCNILSCNGIIDLTVTGGNGPFTFEWSNGSNMEDIFDACEGDHTVVITDANGCTETFTFTLGCNTFDLALTKTVTSEGPFAPGSDVTYAITVINQGTVDATGIVLTDYVPVGMSLNDGTWNADSTYNVGNLAAGASTTVTLTLQIGANYNGTSLVNYAEISAADNADGLPDVDSSPDGDNTNDAGGASDSPADGAVDGDGTGVPGDGDPTTDEDDHDPASIDVVQVVSLGSTVFSDINDNGIQDPGEPGIPNVILELWSAGPDGEKGGGDDMLTTTTSTDESGLYWLEGLTPGRYYVVIPNPDANYSASSTDGSPPADPDLNTDGDDNGLQMGGSGTMVMSEVIELTPGDEPTGTDESAPGGDQDVDADDDNGNMTLDFGFIPNFDLALTKTIANVGPYNAGEDVTFILTIINQGTADATDIVLTEYVPAGMTLNDPDWIGGTYNLDALAAGETTTVEVTLSINSDYQGIVAVNEAEILSASNPANSPDIDSTPDGDNTDDAGGAVGTPSDDAVDGDGTGDPDDGVAATDEDDHDPALIEVFQEFDLALTKTLVTTGVIYPGDPIEFIMTVTNQGTLDATNVLVVDYIPPGVTLSKDPHLEWIEILSIAGWTAVGSTPLAPGESVSESIFMTVNADFTGDEIVNYAEIGSADNVPGYPDVDSTPDQDNTNDAGGAPNSPADDAVDGNGTGTPGDGVAETDEDDHDPSLVQVVQLMSLGSTVFSDDNDNGTQDSGELGIPNVNVELWNAGPDGVKGGVDDTQEGTQTTNEHGEFWFEGLPPGRYYIVIPTPDPNYLTSSTDPSPPADPNDNVDGDDDGQQMGGSGTMVMSDVIELTPGDEPMGTDEGSPGGDQDDATDDDNGNMTLDFGFIPNFDLALTKTIANSGPYTPGEDVTFILTIINQGVADASDIVLTEYVPAGMTLNDADWIGGTYNLGSLAAGESTTVEVTLNIDPDFQGAELINEAEILSATNPAESPDIDSTPDGNDTNDAGGEAGTSSDDAVDGDGSGNPGDGDANTDEDDHDPEKITVGQVFDLALTKVLTSTGTFYPGSNVTFTINIINQGSVDATDIIIKDYIPSGMTLNDLDWNADATYNLVSLSAGASTSVDITLSIDANFLGTELVNYAEISSASNSLGLPDNDSTPDETNGNDPGGAPDSPADDAVNGNGSGTPGDGVAGTDEDDHDPASLSVCDLIPPTIICPPGETLLCNATPPLFDLNSVSVSDNTEGALGVQYLGDTEDINECVKTVTRTYKATDACNNMNTCTQYFTIPWDLTPPNAVCRDVTVQLDEDGLASIEVLDVNNGSSDGCSDLMLEIDLDAFSCLDKGLKQVTLSAEDDCGNIETCTSTVTVSDNIPPELICPTDVTLYPDENCFSELSDTVVTASDNCDFDLEWTFVNFEPGGPVANIACGGGMPVLPGGQQIQMSVEVVATDLSGNMTTCEIIIEVFDTIPPVIIECPQENLTLACNATVPDPDPLIVHVEDACNDFTVTWEGDDVEFFEACVKTVIRTYTCQDECDNTSFCIQNFTIPWDADEPVLDCPDDVTLICNSETPDPNTQLVGVTDNCPTDVTWGGDNVTIIDCMKTVVRTYSATDDCLNTGTCTQTISIPWDTTPPTIACPDNATVQCGGSSTPDQTGIATGSDNCGTVIITSFDVPGVPPPGTDELIVRTWTATDPCGNTVSCIQVITVLAFNNPIASCHPDVGAVLNNYEVTIPAFVLNNNSISCSGGELSFFVSGEPTIYFVCEDIGLHTVQLEVKDEFGNSSFCSSNIVVQENSEPDIECPANITVDGNCDGFYVEVPLAEVSDNCLQSIVNDFNDTNDASDFYPFGTTMVTFDATDIGGNVGTCSFEVTVIQSPVPVNLSTTAEPDPTNPSSYNLAWDPVVGSVACQIKGGPEGGGDFASIIVMGNEVSSKEIGVGLLTPGTSYQWKVRCACATQPSIIVGPFSAYDYFTYPTPTPGNNGNGGEAAQNKKLLVKSQLVVSPNPNKGWFYLSTDMEDYTLEILDLTGKVILSEAGLNENRLDIDLHDFGSGLYFIKVYNTEAILTEKIVVEF